MRVGEGGVDVAIALADDVGFGGVAVLERARRVGRLHDRIARSDGDLDQLGGVLGDIGIVGEHDGDRLADIAHDAVGQDRLLVGLERLQPGEAERNARDVRDVLVRPHRMHAGQGERGGGIDTLDLAMRDRRAHHAHDPLAGEVDVGGEAAAAGQQRPVFQARQRAADDFLLL